MSLGRLLVACEGATEVEFVRKVLGPALLPFGARAEPRSLDAKGRFDLVVNRTSRCVKEGAWVTTLFDYYGLVGKPEPVESPASLERRKAVLEEELRRQVASLAGERYRADRFVPYVQMHEFEALLFSEPAKLARVLGRDDLEKTLTDVRSEFPTPEFINDSFDTSPSHRIIELHRPYKRAKPQLGVLAAQAIGLETMRRECPLFSEWVARLERLGEE